jgi:predicted RNase H-like HicB family nuclease
LLEQAAKYNCMIVPEACLAQGNSYHEFLARARDAKCVVVKL